MVESHANPAQLINLPVFSRTIHQRTLDLAASLGSPFQNHPEFQRFSSLVNSYLGEGKTLRALGVAVGAFLAGSKDFTSSPLIRDLGVAMEFYQASALVHDDLIDDVDLRRSHATIQVAARQFLPADAADAAAVLVGDYLLSLNHAATNIALAEASAPLRDQIHAYMAGITAEVAWGQYLDILTETHSLEDTAGLRAHVLDVITVKSGYYSVMRPLVLGAISEGGSAELIAALETAGTAWGIAFQMRDDEIGMFGEESVTGKPVSSDLAEGKRTILLSLVLERVSAQQRKVLLNALGNKEITETEVALVREIIRDCGAYAVHEELIADYVNQGFAAFENLALHEKHQQIIREFAGLLVNRKF
ncbi:polyprenyl synthetase [Gleimia coleocanis DSM 15436]|uniref:Polyprenyl synthetase n=1 Tax=Gleimia coleocanis DSM 15436 TaxID=525245 RepID=C0W1U0_9ACTO|nr:polyprenyl synthetase family protein [Gleimia coleocanis]EEH63456.1 polyprenyl synthetase [Gleimia coleocanis DSM 15436]